MTPKDSPQAPNKKAPSKQPQKKQASNNGYNDKQLSALYRQARQVEGTSSPDALDQRRHFPG